MQEATATVASKKAFEFSIQSLMEKTRSPTGNSGSTSLTSPTSPALQNPQVMGGLHAANQFLLNLAALSSLQEAFMDNLRQGGGGVVMSPTHPAFAGALPSSLPGFMASYPVDNGALTAAVGAMRRGHILSPESRNMNHCMTSSFKRQLPDSFRAASAMDFGHSSSSASSVMQGLSKPKRIRTAFSPGQLVQLEAAFDNNPYVVGQERRDLASQLNLTETQVKVWFQNRRTKQKRGRSEGEEEETIIIHE